MRWQRFGSAALVFAAVLTAAACGGGGDDGGGQTTASGGCTNVSEPSPREDSNREAPTSQLDAGKTYRVVVETNCGEFTITLDTETSPKTSASFVALAEDGYFDDTVFHRIVPGFVIQGGDPTGSGTGGPGYFVDEQPPENLSYVRGVVAMAKTQAEPPGRSGSQFFVVTQPDAGLTPDYALLGRVSAGMDVVDRIEALGSPDGVPRAPVVIRGITIQRPGT